MLPPLPPEEIRDADQRFLDDPLAVNPLGIAKAKLLIRECGISKHTRLLEIGDGTILAGLIRLGRKLGGYVGISETDTRAKGPFDCIAAFSLGAEAITACLPFMRSVIADDGYVVLAVTKDDALERAFSDAGFQVSLYQRTGFDGEPLYVLTVK